jgi:3-hydroxybutyryl-CoA dehydrogenase
MAILILKMINNITVLGAGTMGRGIARLFALHQYKVTIYDPNSEALGSFEKENKAGGEYLKYTGSLSEAIPGADLVIESVTENFEIKRALYHDLEIYIKDAAIVASNTSSYSLAILSEGLKFEDRMVITHFFNPADLIPLVEIVSLPHTQKKATEQVVALMSTCGKTPVLLNKDIKGFIANRLQAAVLREACFLLESGIADAEQIDKAMTAGIGPRWAIAGPFEISDRGGLDIWEKVLKNLLPELSNETSVPAIISEKVNEHQLGLKTGKGFFDHLNADNAAYDVSLNRLLSLKKELKK